ncbi:hypothetical protein AURDEDRAFT_161393 [Auricularia subglabra TFB-10046 SS5]|nr:hypothetical protein AURDEDRAFT_161393 [Auricularia subglabra TFB-10046 SS5]
MSHARSKPPARAKYSGIDLRETITPTVTRRGTVRGDSRPRSQASDIAEEEEEASQTLPGGWEQDAPDRMTAIARQETGYVPTTSGSAVVLPPESFLAQWKEESHSYAIPNPHSSSSSSSEDGDRSDDPGSDGSSGHRRKKAKRRKKRKARRHEKRLRMLRDLKIPMPTYNGIDDYDTFEAFIGKWDSYARSHGLKGSDAIDVIQHALKGKASIWYNKHVSLQLEGWTTKRVYQELYEYCFPASFREDLREKLMSATQRGRPVKDYAKDLENLALRYSDIDAATVKRIFWDGVDDYIKLYWLDKGLGQEYSTLETLMVEHRAQKRCYHCHKEGHDSSKCRLKSRHGEPGIRAAAVAPADDVPAAEQKPRVHKPKVRRQLKALPSAAVSVMSTSFHRNELLAFVHIAVHLAAPEAHGIQIRRQQLKSHLVRWHNPATAFRRGLRDEERRFHIFAAGDADAPDPMPEYLVAYDEVREAELVFPVTAFSALGVDVGRAVYAHLGVAERDLGRIFKLPGRPAPLVEPIFGALTRIGTVWAVVRTVGDLVDCGGNDTDRWLLQTNGVEFWVRDQLYGTCYEIPLSELTEGITLAEALGRAELPPRPGTLMGREEKRCTSFPADATRDWQLPQDPSVAEVTRRAEWMQFIAERSARPFSRDANYRPGQAGPLVERVFTEEEIWAEYAPDDSYHQLRRFGDDDEPDEDATSDEQVELLEDYSGDYGPPPDVTDSSSEPSSTDSSMPSLIAPPNPDESISEIVFDSGSPHVDHRPNLAASESDSSLFDSGSLVTLDSVGSASSAPADAVVVALPRTHGGELRLRLVAPGDVELLRGAHQFGADEYVSHELGYGSDASYE